MKQKLFSKGFVLIELLAVIVIIAVLAVVVFITLDPVKRFADTRNSYRWTDVNNILTAVHQSTFDNNGELPAGLSVGMDITQIGTAASGCNISCPVASASSCVNLNAPLAKYLKEVPEDPDTGTPAETGYYIVVDENKIVTVAACAPENGKTVESSR